jgi:hypothetical protein
MIINYPSITQFQQHVELKDFREPTKKEYVRYVRKLAEHFQYDPAYRHPRATFQNFRRASAKSLPQLWLLASLYWLYPANDLKILRIEPLRLLARPQISPCLNTIALQSASMRRVAASYGPKAKDKQLPIV